MKNILVPVDFSDVSKTATLYALNIAKQFNASVTLFHVFHIPVVAAESIVAMPNFDDLEQASNAALKNFEQDVCSAIKGDILVNTLVKPGFLIEEMEDAVKEKSIDLIVMGITGAGKLGEILMGSNATIAIHKMNCPVIVVPKGAQYKKIENMVFACDYDKATSTQSIEKVKQFAALFGAQLHVLNVVDKEEVPDVDKAVKAVRLEVIMGSLRHTLNFPESDDITFAINEFVEKHAIDMVIMIPHKHKFLGSLFHKSNTKSMAFHTHVPLLSINE
jgi:nucleotide-binding universal stress UspA family protein